MGVHLSFTGINQDTPMGVAQADHVIKCLVSGSYRSGLTRQTRLSCPRARNYTSGLYMIIENLNKSQKIIQLRVRYIYDTTFFKGG